MSKHSFASLFAFAAANRSMAAKRKPAKFTRKWDGQSIAAAIDKPASLDANGLLEAIDGKDMPIAFSTDCGEGKVSAPEVVDAVMSRAYLAALIFDADLPTEESPELPTAITERGQNVGTNGKH